MIRFHLSSIRASAKPAGAVLVLTLATLLSACDAIVGKEDERLEITNEGKCTMRAAYTGSVGTGDSRDDWEAPLSKERVRVIPPGGYESALITGEGAVTVTIASAPSGTDVPCSLYLSLDSEGSEGKFILTEVFYGTTLAAHGMGVTLYSNPKWERTDSSTVIRVVEQ